MASKVSKAMTEKLPEKALRPIIIQPPPPPPLVIIRPPPPVSLCRDNHVDCPKYVNQCFVGDYGKVMRIQCRKTCRYCI
ncbi:unnamed protein product [Dracunculus medinensis]|uniref:ShKT domain-containing protein n=1 Tax=Dracunculus medinensis TaxID=318479 RepID=A0A0N4UMZ3_DRAME|nr:unnamed protein product [Dracunculus medinensis]